MDYEKRKKGRPSKLEQLKIERMLLPFFTQGLTSLKTSEITNLHRHTVEKKFQKFYNIHTKNDKTSWIKEENIERRRLVISLDSSILEIIVLIENMKNILKEKNNISIKEKTSVHSQILKYIKHKTDLQMQKYVTVANPSNELILQMQIDNAIDERFPKST